MQPKLATCLEVAEWRGGNEALETVLFTEADCVTATGSDETLREIRNRLAVPFESRQLGTAISGVAPANWRGTSTITGFYSPSGDVSDELR